MLVKTIVLDMIQRFSNDFSIDELVKKLQVQERVEKGNK